MNLQKLNVKFFVESDHVRLTDFIPIFNSWIQSSDGEYYDLADYSHMVAGPGILLIAHEANLGIDQNGNRTGLLYNCKRPLEGSNQEKLRWIFKRALENCRRIEEEQALQGKFKFRGNEAFVLINDRLLAPNTAETFDAVKPDLGALAQRLYGGAEFSIDRGARDSRERFSIYIRSPIQFEISTLLKNLGDN